MLLEQPIEALIWTDDGQPARSAACAIIPRPDGALGVVVSSPAEPVMQVALRWAMPLAPSSRVLGDHWERSYGDMEWRGIVPERVLPWYALAHSPEGTIGVGVETGAASMASWRVDEAGVTLLLDLRSGGVGVRLGQRELTAATVHSLTSEPGESAYAFARRFCRQLCPSHRTPALPVYGSNDWYHRYGAISHATVLEDAAVIRDLATDATNPPYHVLDCGWFPAGGVDGGPYSHGNHDFPDMPGLAGAVRGLGVRPGIWIRPLYTTEAVPAAWRVPEGHPQARAPHAMLDPSVPEVLELVRRDVARLAAWGYELVKFDFTTYDILGRWGFEMAAGVTAPGWAFADRSRTTAEVIRGLYEAIRAAAGSACVIGCNTIGHLGAGLFEVQRTGDDTSGRFWERTRRMGPNALAFRMPQHGTFFSCDADCVGLTAQVPWEWNRMWLELVAHSATPLFVSVDASTLNVESRAAVREALALAAAPRAPGEPLDWLETTCPRRWRFAEGDRTFDWPTFPGAALPCPG